MDKVLILTEEIGGRGHYQAAQAIRKGLNWMEPDLEVEVSCGLSHFSRSLESFIRKVYLNTLQYAPGLWGAAYSKEHEFSEAFRSSLSRILLRKMREMLNQYRPRVVVNTHAFCLGAMAELKDQVEQPFYLGAAITDFDVNGFWVHPAVDFYFVAHQQVAETLKKRFGVSEHQIYQTGIPIDPIFSEPFSDRQAFRRKVGIDVHAFSVLLMRGGVGLGPMEQVIAQFLEDMPEAHLIVVTGKNKELLTQLQSSYQHEKQVHLMGYVNGIRDWMAASDLIVTKPGGLTSSEALATGLPILISQPIPGQEERNSQFLIQQGVALRQDLPQAIPREIRPLMETPSGWQDMRQRALNLGRPQSSLDAAEIIADYVH